jgi:hypothetical protein
MTAGQFQAKARQPKTRAKKLVQWLKTMDRSDWEPLCYARWLTTVVAVQGYDIKILPTSGVIQGAILWMVNAEMLGILEARCTASAPSR